MDRKGIGSSVETGRMATSGSVENRLMVNDIDARGALEREVGLKMRT